MKITPFIYISLYLFFSYSGLAQQTSGKVTVKTTSDIDRVISKKKAFNKSIKTMDGYKIQLFFGVEKKAYEAEDEFSSLFPDIPVKIIFSSPDWKVQAGNFMNRLDADRALIDIKNDFPGAIVLETEIDIL
ncbi:MAG: SPOR domain-containing protein [Bacteroidota bacterium]